MRKSKNLYFALIFLFLCVSSYSQRVEKIKFKKDRSVIYFFPKGTHSDTLHKSQETVFYLVVPDSLKKDLSLEVENGQLMATPNDSLVKLNYLPGFKYESFYEEKSFSGKKGKGPDYEFKTMVDGISVFPPEKISISLINKRTGGLILENVFVCLR